MNLYSSPPQDWRTILNLWLILSRGLEYCAGRTKYCCYWWCMEMIKLSDVQSGWTSPNLFRVRGIPARNLPIRHPHPISLTTERLQG